MNIKFGTDGWRAVIAEDFSFRNLDRAAQATADFWNAQSILGTTKTIVAGYTTDVFCQINLAVESPRFLRGMVFRSSFPIVPCRRRRFPLLSSNIKLSAA